MNMRRALITLIIGIALGAVGAVYLPGTVEPYLPDALSGKRMLIKGIVVAKEKKPAALLLTVNTPQGALLASFSRNVDETDLLVGPGDAIELRIGKYEPFVGEPKIMRVMKSGQAALNEPEAAAAGSAFSARTGTGEVKPPAGGKTSPAAPPRKGPRP